MHDNYNIYGDMPTHNSHIFKFKINIIYPVENNTGHKKQYLRR